MAVSGGGSGGKGSAVRAGAAYVELSAKDAGLASALDRAKRGVLGLSKVFAGIGGGLLGAGGGVLAPLLASFQSAVKHMADMKDAADRLGASTEDLSALGYAAEQTGSSMEDVAGAAKFLHRNLVENADEFARFGLDAEKLKDMGLADQFQEVADAIGRLPEAEQGAAAMALMGRAGDRMVPMLRELRQLRGRAGLVGAIVSTEDADAADRMGDALDDLSKAFKYTFMSVGASFLSQTDSAETFATTILTALQDVRAFINENRQVIQVVAAVAAGVAAAGAALVAIGGTLAVVSFAIGGLTAAASALGAVLAVVFSPVGFGVLAVAGATAAIVGFSKETGGIKGLLSDLGQTFKDTFEGFKDAVMAGEWEAAFDIVIAGLKVAWKSFLETIWQSTQVMFQKLKKETRDLGADAALARGKNPEDAAWWDSLRVLADEFNADVLGGKRASDRGALVRGADGKMALSPEDAALSEAVKKNTEALEASKKAYDDAIAEIMKPSAELTKAREDLAKRVADAKAAAAKAALWREHDDWVARMMAQGAAGRMAGVMGVGATRGQFGAAGLAASLGINTGSPVDKIAQNTEDTAKNTKKIADNGLGLRVE